MTIRRFGRTCELAIAGSAVVMMLAARATAASYVFTSVVSTSTSSFSNFGYGPTINDSGKVAFVGFGATFSDQGVYVRDMNGGSVTTIADTSGPLAQFLFDPVINNAGTVVFEASTDSVGSEIRTGNGGSTTLIAAGGSTSYAGNTFINVHQPSINNAGTVAFSANLDTTSAAFTSSGGVLTQRFSGGVSPFIRIGDSDKIVLGATLANPTPPPAYGLIMENHGPFSILALQSPDGPYDVLDPRPAINANDTVTFQTYEGGVNKIYSYNGSTLVTIAQTGNAFGDYNQLSTGPAISDNGLVVFGAAVNSSPGIFTGPSPVADKVVKLGDTVASLGGFVTDLSFVSGVNAHGQIAFKYSVFTGTETVTGIAVATPNTTDEISTGSDSTSVGGGSATVGGVDAGFNSVTTGGQFSADFFRPDSSNELAVRIGEQATDLVTFNLASDDNFQVWTLDFSGQFNGDANLVFRYDDTNLDVPESSLVIRHFTEGEWVIPAGQILDTLNNTITLSADSFSPFVLSAIPEPAAASLLATALGAMRLRRVRARRKSGSLAFSAA